MNIARRLSCRVPRVNLTYRWVAGPTHCVLSTSRRSGSCAPIVCAMFSRAKFPLVGGWGNKWSSSWGLVLLLLILVSVFLIGTLINIRREHRQSGQRPSCTVVHFPSRESCPLGWRKSLATVTTSPIFQRCVFLFPLYIFLGEQAVLFFSRV